MSKTKNFPLFLVDRSKLDPHPFDFIVCMHKSWPFVARVVHLPTGEQFAKFQDEQQNISGADYVSISMPFKRGGVVLVVEKFFYDFEPTPEVQEHIRVLLRKALKKYIYAEVYRTPADDLGLENQIRQQELTIERARANYADLVRRANGSTEYADYQISLATATLESLRKLRDNQKYYSFNVN